MRPGSTLLLLLLLAAFSAAAADQASTVQELCSHTQNEALCISSTKPFLVSSEPVTASSLLNAETQAVRSRMKKVTARLSVLIDSPPKLDSGVLAGDPGVQGMYNAALGNCRSQISGDAMDALGKGSDAMRNLDINEYLAQLSAVTSFVSSCQLDLDTIPATYWPATDVQEIIDMAGNCMGLMKLVAPAKAAK